MIELFWIFWFLLSSTNHLKWHKLIIVYNSIILFLKSLWLNLLKYLKINKNVFAPFLTHNIFNPDEYHSSVNIFLLVVYISKKLCCYFFHICVSTAVAKYKTNFIFSFKHVHKLLSHSLIQSWKIPITTIENSFFCHPHTRLKPHTIFILSFANFKSEVAKKFFTIVYTHKKTLSWVKKCWM